MIEEFTKALRTISFARAGWDYQLQADVRAREAVASKAAMDTARRIWKENPDRHADLTTAFRECGPLATLDEISR